MDGVKKVYVFSNLNEFYKADLDNIELLLNAIHDKKIKCDKYTRQLAIDSLELQLEKIRNLIQQ